MNKTYVATPWVDDTTTDSFSWFDDQTGGPNLIVRQRSSALSLSPQQQFILTIAQKNAMTTTNSVWNTPSSSPSTKYFAPTMVNTNPIANFSVYVNNTVIDDDFGGDHNPHVDSKVIRIDLGVERTIQLPDGGKIEVKADGSYEILDANAKVTYKASRFRDFNPYLNASDMLEKFIDHCDTVGVQKTEMLRLPLELFVAWLVISAARQDDVPAPDLPLDVNLKRKALPKCTGCGRFLARSLRERSLEFCAPRCYGFHQSRALAAPPPQSALVPMAEAA